MKKLTIFFGVLACLAIANNADAFAQGAAALIIVKPNGNELFATGDTTTIEWTGVQPQDTVLLEFSTDNGKSWSLITDMATGLQYRWAIPALSSDNCLMRVAERAFPRSIQTLVHKRAVVDLAFTPDGTEILTAVDDGGIKMWSATNGSPRYSIDSAKARYISISPSGKYFSVSNLMNDASIWDVVTGRPINRGFGFTSNSIGRIAFYSEDSIAYPSGRNVNLGRYEPNRFTVYFTLDNNNSVNDVRYNALKTRLIAASNTDTAIVWNFKNRAKIAQLPHKSDVWTVDISADASRALTNDKAGNVYYWNATNSTLIAQLGDKNFTSSRLSPDGKYALGGGRTQTLTVNGQNQNYADGVVWDVTSHNPVRYLRGHRLGITSVCYSSDGKFMATASMDSTVRIWDLSDKQSTVSASTWRITQPLLSAVDIDMGKEYAGEQKDSVIMNVISNQSLADVRVQSVRLTGGDSSKFLIKSNVASQTIIPGSSENIEVVFMPDALRVFSTTLEIITQNQVITRIVRGEGVRRLARWTSGINLGKVYVGDRRDSTVQLVITNVSDVPLTITTTLQANAPDITMLGGNGDITIEAGQPHTVTLAFAPVKEGIVNTALQIEFDGYGAPVIIPVSGEGVCARGTETVQAGSAEAIPGQTITIPIVISFPDNTLRSLSRLYSYDVRFNRTVLLPTDTSQLGTISGADRIVRFSGRQNGNDTLLWLTLTAATGTSDKVPITVENFEWTDCRTGADAVIGEVRVGVCQEGSPRLYNPDGETAMLAVLPNMVRGEGTRIRFRTAEIGLVEISIVNVMGKITPIFSGEMTTGEYTLPIREQLSAGVYFVRMTTPTQVLVERVVVE